VCCFTDADTDMQLAELLRQLAGTMLRKDMHALATKVLRCVRDGYGLDVSVVRVNAMELPKDVDKPSMEKLLKILAKPPKRSKKAMKELAAKKEEEETRKRRLKAARSRAKREAKGRTPDEEARAAKREAARKAAEERAARHRREARAEEEVR